MAEKQSEVDALKPMELRKTKKRPGARLWHVVILMLILSGAAYSVLTYGVIVTSRETIVYRKHEPTIERTYTDTRGWGPIDYTQNPEIAKILVEHGYDVVLTQLRGSPLNQPIEPHIERAVDSIRSRLRHK